jgi:hypothetical protein
MVEATMVVGALVRDGPAVDGLSVRRDATIDARGMDVRRLVMQAVRHGTRMETDRAGTRPS